MSVSFTITEQELIDSFRLHYKVTENSKFISLVILALVIAFVLISGHNSLLGYVGFGLIFGCIFSVIKRCMLCGSMPKKIYQQTVLMRKAASIELHNDRVAIKSEYSSLDLHFDHLLQWKESEQLILLYINEYYFHIIPTRIQADELDINMLRERLTAVVGSPLVSHADVL